MPVPTDITAGTISISGSTVTGVGTSFVASDIRQGDLFIWIEGGAGQWSPIVQTVTSNTTLTLVEPWTGPTISGARYRLRYQWDSSRVSAQSRQLIEMLDNGNVLALAGLTGPGVPVFDGPHSMTIRPEQDFINGVAYDVQVDTLADRPAYDGQAAGFAVLVSDVGDGRSAVYSKASNTSGDWTDPAYITGPVGPLADLEFTAVGLPPGSAPTVTQTPIAGGYDVELGIPEGRGARYVVGGYNPATTYTLDQAVQDNGSTWILTVPTSTGNAPPVLPTTSNAYWSLLARAGADGTGTGDVVGPASSVADRIAVYDGTTGKLLKDGGKTISELAPANDSVTNAILANVPTGTFKARATAGAGDPEDLTAAQALTLLKGAGAYAKDNILGTVSQSGGVPTGAIIESGNNANGRYMRFANGAQVCWFNSNTIYNTSTAAGGFQYTAVIDFTFPIAFSEVPTVSQSVTYPNTGSFAWPGPNATPSTTGVGLIAASASAAGAVRFSYIAVGRWF